MRKRKVLALLLALSMAVSTNGMAVYAAEPNIAVATEEGGAEQTETGDITESEQSGDSSDLGDKDESNSGENDQSKDENDGDSSDKDDQNKDDEDKDGEDKGSEEKDEQTEMTETPVDPEEGEELDDVISEDKKDELSEEENDEKTDEKTDEVRMETFTDDTGMTITYDAVMATSFDVEVRGGTLYAVPDAEGVLDLREEEIETVDGNAFKGNTDIKYIMLPKSVKTIGASAFEGCSSLKGISIPSRLTTVGARAFKDCTSLTQLALPNSVTSIGESAFQGDNKLFMVHMISAEYSKLETIGTNAFYGCSSLEFFCSDNSYYLPESITTIGDTAFYGCRKLSKISMRDTVASLGVGAFENCTGISEVTLSSGLSKIPENAFSSCISLVQINFGNNNIAVNTEIASKAFANCSRLGSVELPEQVNKVCENAFEGCTSLKRVYVKNGRAALDKGAFPNQNVDLCLVSTAGSTTAKYADEADVRFVATDELDKVEYYQYKAQISGTGTGTNQIKLKVTKVKSTDSKTPDINTITHGKNTNNGVTAGTTCYLQIDYGKLEGVKLVAGSLKCNGTPLTASGGWYSFAMPIGGATITAEFELAKGEVLIEGNEDTVEGRLSLDATFVVNKDKSGSATLKVGQSTKFYLTDSMIESGSRIPTSKVTYSLSKNSKTGIVSIAKDGTVKALKAGTAVVCADVKNISGVTIRRMVTIKVEQSPIDHISMLVPSYDKNSMTILKEAVDDEGKALDEITGISVPTKKVTKNYTFNLQAVAFSSKEEDEAMAVTFTWSTSDAKIAKLAKTSTTSASSVNTVTIPINTDGEATITVTTTNADKTKKTQKFVVRVENYTPRLVSSKITVNPNQDDGTAKLEIISAYGKPINLDTFRVVSGQGDFTFEYDTESKEPVSTYKVSALDGLPDKTYSVKIEVKVDNTPYTLPLSIVVKKSVPNPKVAFAKNQKKINLFYANDKTQIKPVISGLGSAKVSKYSLEPLTTPGSKTYEDDAKFIQNFAVDKDANGNPVITQQSEKLAYNKSKKPVVTGYLVLQFDGYKDTVKKKYKITIPTQTVTPAYVLSTTSNTFGTSFNETQVVYLQLLDKKTKKQIDLGTGEYNLEIYNTSTIGSAGTKCEIIEAANDTGVARDADDAQHSGWIKVTLPNPDKGKLVMKLTNDTWAAGKSFLYTYTIKRDTNMPKISLKKSTVTLNTSYPEQEASFAFASNQYDTKVDEEQKFEIPGKLKASDIAQYEKLDVSYENGVGKVSIKEGETDIKAGTYKFTCTVKKDGWPVNTVTLNVKVTKTMPTVTLKGANSFNLSACKTEDGKTIYVEQSEMTLTAKNLPKDYTLDTTATLATVGCTTKGYESVKDAFDFSIADGNKIKISLKEDARIQKQTRTYSFRIMPTYSYSYDGEKNEVKPAKYLTFTIKVYNGDISVKLGAKGKINLVDRSGVDGKCTEKNGIRYTPTFTNLKDTLVEGKDENGNSAGVILLDASGALPWYTDESKISKQFEAVVAPGGKSFYIVPKAGAELQNKKTYKLRVWMKTKGYDFNDNGGGIYAPAIVKVTTAEVLPKVKTNKTTVNLYLSSKSYETTFKVQKSDAKVVGKIESIDFGEKDSKAIDSFEISSVRNEEDGSLLVHLKLKNGVSYKCNSTNKIKMYVKFEGQGTNTAGTAITMNVKINK